VLRTLELLDKSKVIKKYEVLDFKQNNSPPHEYIKTFPHQALFIFDLSNNQAFCEG